MTDTFRPVARKRRLAGALTTFALALCFLQAISLQAWHDVDCHEPVCAVCAFADAAQMHAAQSNGPAQAMQAFSLTVDRDGNPARPAGHFIFKQPRAPPHSS